LEQGNGCQLQQNATHAVLLGPIENSALLAVSYGLIYALPADVGLV
jgi:hypothetical protein